MKISISKTILYFIIVFLMTATLVGEDAIESDLFVSPERMEEWNDWRFGLFIHWGPWSQTEIGYIWHIVNDDPPGVREKRFELYKTFNPVNFDPQKWARAAKYAGMKYVVFVVKHHDGLNNYDTALSDFKITSPEVPYHKDPKADIGGAIIEAFRAEGMAVGFYYSHIDWHHPDGKFFSRNHWDYNPAMVDKDPESWKRFVEYEQGQLRELLTNYGKIDIIWFDIYWPFASYGGQKITHPQVKKDVLDTIRMMKELQPDIIYNDRGTGIYGAFYTPEQRIPATGLPGNWESNITITNSRGFWYKGDSVSSKTPKELIRMLVDIASKGGNFLMNVGPRPDGELSEGEYVGMKGVGDWMKVNSESIYGTDKSAFLDLPWGRSTTKGHTLYLHVFDWPKDGKLQVPGLRNSINKAYLLTDKNRKPLHTLGAEEDKIIHVGSDASHDAASVVVVEIEGSPDINNSIREDSNGVISLGSAYAAIESTTASYNYGKGTTYGNYIENIKSTGDTISWDFITKKPGSFRINVLYASKNNQSGSTYTLNIDDLVSFKEFVHGTADWDGDISTVRIQTEHGLRRDNRGAFKSYSVGTIKIAQTGQHSLTLTPESIQGDNLMYLKSVFLTPLN